MDEQHEIKSSDCECPRGAFKCSHAAALFIHGIHNLSRTDVECQWRKTKSNTSLSAQAVAEMFPPPKKYTALGRKPVQVDRAQLYEDLKQYGRFTGLCWLLSPEPPAFNELPIPTIEDIIFSEQFLQTRGLQQQLECLVRRSRILEEDILKISRITVGQRDNPAWHLARRGRLTASNFGNLLFKFIFFKSFILCFRALRRSFCIEKKARFEVSSRISYCQMNNVLIHRIE